MELFYLLSVVDRVTLQARILTEDRCWESRQVLELRFEGRHCLECFIPQVLSLSLKLVCDVAQSATPAC